MTDGINAADETLFENILHIKQHVLHQLLPDKNAINLQPSLKKNMTVHLL